MIVDSVFVGAQVRKLRKDNHMTQKQFARKLNLTQQTLSRYESGTTHIPYSELISIVNYFKVPIEYFFGLEVQSVTSDELRLVAYYRSLSSVLQPRALELMKTLSECFSEDK